MNQCSRCIQRLCVSKFEATLDGFVRVRLGEEQVAWVAESQLGNGQGGSLEFQLNHAPPRIEVDYGGTLVTRENSITLRGTAVDETLVRDLYIFAGARKVHYRSTRRADDRTRVSFETEIPMHGGINYITVFARESDEIVSRRLIVVRRDAPDGSLMETPRFDDDVFGNVHYE